MSDRTYRSRRSGEESRYQSRGSRGIQKWRPNGGLNRHSATLARDMPSLIINLPMTSLSNENLFTDSINQFAIKFYQNCSKGEENYFISPYSISMAMTLCYAGSKGSTRDSLKDLLCFRSDINDEELFKNARNFHRELSNANKGCYDLEMTNMLFPRKKSSLNKRYIHLIKTCFSAGINPLDFDQKIESANAINSWVSQMTKNKINEIISADTINERTKVIIINTIYFKGVWTTPFEKRLTVKYDFNLSDGTKTQVDMMRSGKDFKCFDTDFGAAVCELPYRRSDISMTIILPNKDNSLEMWKNH